MLDGVLMVVLAICLYTDVRYKKVYNAVLFPAAVIAVIGNLYFSGLAGGINCIKGMFLGMALIFIPFAAGGMGAGDVKLMGVVGVFKGPEFVWLSFLATAIIGGLLAIAVMVKDGQLKVRVKEIWYTFLSLLHVIPRVNMVGSMNDGRVHLTFPYGIAITAGTLVAYIVR
jgi:prepilin peptidase CpaA